MHKRVDRSNSATRPWQLVVGLSCSHSPMGCVDYEAGHMITSLQLVKGTGAGESGGYLGHRANPIPLLKPTSGQQATSMLAQAGPRCNFSTLEPEVYRIACPITTTVSNNPYE